jgi:uncharacterized protein (DUF952 family)
VSRGDVFHLATPHEWAAAQARGTVEPPSLAAEGFVHCSTGDQLDDTIARHFDGVDDLVLLRLRADGLGDALRWEESRPGEDFPHVYRAIRLDEVAEAIPWHRAD